MTKDIHENNVAPPDVLAPPISLDARRELGCAAMKERLDMGFRIEKVANSLGIGTGLISAEEIAAEAGPEVMKRVDEAIMSPEIIVPVDLDENGNMIDDDGCGDGRFTKLIQRGKKLLLRSLHRPKVFGGGATMGAADLIGSGNAKGNDLHETFQQSMTALNDSAIDFGAHTAENVADGKCGCGAIDESPHAVQCAAAYRQDITDQFVVLGVDTEGLDVVLDNFASFAEQIADKPFEGAAVMTEIADAKKVVKQLGGKHVEARIVLNFVRGMTVNQQFVRAASGGLVDVFGVDVWRMQDIAHRLHPQDATAERQAFQSMLVYTLATAAVLTKGDLPVYAVQTGKIAESKELQAA